MAKKLERVTVVVAEEDHDALTKAVKAEADRLGYRITRSSFVAALIHRAVVRAKEQPGAVFFESGR